MLKSFNNKKNIQDQNIDLVKIVSLLIHAAKIDENYTEKEKKLILKFIPIFLKENNEKNILESELDVFEKAEKYESASNQILEFTKEAKKIDLKLKKLIIQTLWEIVLSDDKSGIYGLLYIPDQLSGEIKINILNRKK